jgi:hypothetical protein
MLDRVKEAYKELLQVEQVLEMQGCVCCSRSCRKDDIFYSSDGAREYARTGLCEYCFDSLFVDNDASKIRIHVTAAGKELIAQWVMLSKAAKVAQVPEASFPFLVELASGLHKPLRIWQD